MIKYRARMNRIEEVVIEKETKHFVVLPGGRRDGKITEWQAYFDTREEAKQELIRKALFAVAGLQRRLDIAKGQLGNAKGL